ncbi:hypothetical protein, partial [Escherichia coli]|uniref:hypothetical protein n=1 Tax=Escherichia coli TaxID=562 RepID=UPI0032DBCC0C
TSLICMLNANTSLPCAHIIAAWHFKKVTYDSFVPNVFSMEHYMASYAADFFPPCNEIQWRSERILLPSSSADEIHVQASDELVAFKMKWTLGIRQQQGDVITIRHELMLQTSAQC